METVSIKNVTIEKMAALSPMASVADRAYREICREFGASYLVSEMVSAKGLCYGGAGSLELCRVNSSERPYAIQLFGEEPEFMAKAVEIVNRFRPDIIDINMGCPVAKVVKQGGGSALMKTPELAMELVRAAVSAADCPVTVKFRSGWDENNINAVEFACMMESAGAAAVAVHPRTRKQLYGGFADWSVIERVAKAVKIPVIGNGDIRTGADAAKMYRETGCDLVSVARSSNGRPWVFKQIKHFLMTGEELPEPLLEERLEIMMRHIDRLIEYKGEETGIREARKLVAWYLKGVRGSAKIRAAAGELFTRDDVLRVCGEVMEQNQEGEYNGKSFGNL